MKHPAMCTAVASLLLALGCSGSDNAVQPELNLPTSPAFDIDAMDCQMSPEKCAVIQRGIDALKAHANELCRNMGASAQSRYDASKGEGFRDQTSWQGLNMSVFTTPYDGYTNVHPEFWNNPFIDQDMATGALIAHEEKHHQRGDEAAAVAVQDACLNPQA